MKNKLITSLIATAIFWALSYLIGSFANISFNLSEWSGVSRNLISFLGGTLGIVIGAAIATCPE